MKAIADKAREANKQGVLALQKLKYKIALREFSTACHLMPNKSDYAYNAGLALLGLGKHREAIHQFETAVKGYCNHPEKLLDAYEAMSAGYERIGDLEMAIDCLKRAMALDVESSELFSEAARVSLKIGKKEDALKNIRKALAIDPNEIRYHHQLVEILRSVGDIQAAQKALEKGKRLAHDGSEELLACELADTLLLFDEYGLTDDGNQEDH